MYIDNAEITALLTTWASEVRHASETGVERPEMDPRLGQAILAVATRYVSQGRYLRYSQEDRDDAAMQAVLAVLARGHNFDPEKSSNGFGYVTKIVQHAVWQYFSAMADRCEVPLHD